MTNKARKSTLDTTGLGVPTGGTVGQVLTKNSGVDYDTSFKDPVAIVTDAARINVASAATIDLTTAAALATRNIQITGGVNIAGFQIAIGKVYLAKFAASLTLLNSVSLVTPNGADVVISAGDSCMIRAYADNAVEILVLSKATDDTIPAFPCNFRLTLTSNVPVPIADVIGAGTIYCTPYDGNQIALYDGTAWNVRQSAEFSIALAGLTLATPYDIFCYDNAGVPTLELQIWLNANARLFQISKLSGVFTKAIDPTRRYLGTFYPTAANTTEDSNRRRFLWNKYNRVIRGMLRQDPAANWTYTLNAFHQANANALNQLEFVAGFIGDAIDVSLDVNVSNTIAGTLLTSAIGINSVAAAAAAATFSGVNEPVANYPIQTRAKVNYFPTTGYQYISWLEKSAAAGVSTWLGGQNSSLSANWPC